MKTILNYLRIEKAIQIDKLYKEFGDVPPYNEKVIEQRFRYFQVFREVQEHISLKVFDLMKKVKVKKIGIRLCNYTKKKSYDYLV